MNCRSKSSPRWPSLTGTRFPPFAWAEKHSSHKDRMNAEASVGEIFLGGLMKNPRCIGCDRFGLDPKVLEQNCIASLIPKVAMRFHQRHYDLINFLAKAGQKRCTFRSTEAKKSCLHVFFSGPILAIIQLLLQCIVLGSLSNALHLALLLFLASETKFQTQEGTYPNALASLSLWRVVTINWFWPIDPRVSEKYSLWSVWARLASKCNATWCFKLSKVSTDKSQSRMDQRTRKYGGHTSKSKVVRNLVGSQSRINKTSYPSDRSSQLQTNWLKAGNLVRGSLGTTLFCSNRRVATF